MAEWQNGLFGCFSDCKLCVLGFFVPCYVVGKNAEHFQEDCLVHGLLAGLGVQFGAVLRWRLREEKGITGSMMKDGLIYACLPCCALIQEAKEIGWAIPDKIEDADKPMNRT